MKILIVSNLYPPFQVGGYEIACRNIAHALAAKGHEVRVLTSSRHKAPYGAPDSPRVRVVRSLGLDGLDPSPVGKHELRSWRKSLARLSQPWNTSTLLNEIDSFKPDCVYLFNLVGIGGLALVDALNHIGQPYVFHLMDRVPVELKEFPPYPLSLYDAETNAIYAGGEVIAMSNVLRKEIEAMGDAPFVQPVHIIPGWAKTDGPPASRDYLKDGIVRFVTAGTIKEHKGIGLIVEAAARLRADGVENYRIELYGSGDIQRYQEMAFKQGVGDKLAFMGPRTQPELAAIYREADVFLFPTWEREPFGLAPVEAAALGCVPVVTEGCGVAEFMTHEADCLKIERTGAALARLMKAICVGETPLAKLGAGAQALTRGALNFDRCLAQIESVLSQAAARPVPARRPGWEAHALAQLKHDLAQKNLFTRRRRADHLKEKLRAKMNKWKNGKLRAGRGFWHHVLRGLIALRILKEPA